jgi:hypothetical protein
MDPLAKLTNSTLVPKQKPVVLDRRTDDAISIDFDSLRENAGRIRPSREPLAKTTDSSRLYSNKLFPIHAGKVRILQIAQDESHFQTAHAESFLPKTTREDGIAVDSSMTVIASTMMINSNPLSLSPDYNRIAETTPDDGITTE